MARHPDRQIGHEPVRAIARQQRDPAAAFEAQQLQIGRRTPHLIANLGPGELLNATGTRLGEIDRIGLFVLPMVETIQGSPGVCRRRKIREYVYGALRVAMRSGEGRFKFVEGVLRIH